MPVDPEEGVTQLVRMAPEERSGDRAPPGRCGGVPGQPVVEQQSASVARPRRARSCWATRKVSTVARAGPMPPGHRSGGPRPAGRPGRTGPRCGRRPPVPTAGRPARPDPEKVGALAHGRGRSVDVGGAGSAGVDQAAEAAPLLAVGVEDHHPHLYDALLLRVDPVVSTSTTANPGRGSTRGRTPPTVDRRRDTLDGPVASRRARFVPVRR